MNISLTAMQVSTLLKILPYGVSKHSKSLWYPCLCQIILRTKVSSIFWVSLCVSGFWLVFSTGPDLTLAYSICLSVAIVYNIRGRTPIFNDLYQLFAEVTMKFAILMLWQHLNVWMYSLFKGYCNCERLYIHLRFSPSKSPCLKNGAVTCGNLIFEILWKTL